MRLQNDGISVLNHRSNERHIALAIITRDKFIFQMKLEVCVNERALRSISILPILSSGLLKHATKARGFFLQKLRTPQNNCTAEAISIGHRKLYFTSIVRIEVKTDSTVIDLIRHVQIVFNASYLWLVDVVIFYYSFVTDEESKPTVLAFDNKIIFIFD
jgi:hypothetical protein